MAPLLFFRAPKIYFGEEAITSLCQFNNKRVGIVTDDFMMSSGKNSLFNKPYA